MASDVWRVPGATFTLAPSAKGSGSVRAMLVDSHGCAPLGLLAADGADVASKPIAARRACHQRSGGEYVQAHVGANTDEFSLRHADEFSAANGRRTGVGIGKDAAVGERYGEISIRRNRLPRVRIRQRESHWRTVDVRFRDAPHAARVEHAWREGSVLANAGGIVCQEALAPSGRLQNDFRGYPVYRLVAAHRAAVSAHAVLTVIPCGSLEERVIRRDRQARTKAKGARQVKPRFAKSVSVIKYDRAVLQARDDLIHGFTRKGSAQYCCPSGYERRGLRRSRVGRAGGRNVRPGRQHGEKRRAVRIARYAIG